MDELLRSVLQWLGPLRRVRGFTQHPVATQERILRDLVTRAQDTEWGRRYGFAEIADAPDVVSAYQERVPLHTYDDLREDATRIRDGAADVTWPGTITNFAVSSGTVSDGKIIPVTDELIANDRTFSLGAGLNYLKQTLDYRFLLGKHLTLPGRIEEDENFPGTMIGEISGLLSANAPGFFRTLYQAVPDEVSFLPNWETKLQTIAERTVDRDIRLLVMAPTWGLVLFEKLIDEYNRRHGANATTVAEVWPNLQVFISGGVALQSYRALLDKQIGKEIDFVETYGASEGFFSFQNDLEDPAMLLHLDNGLFYEFVRADEKDAENPTRHTIADVETGVRYALYITSCSGLWSYDVGDVVRFTQTFPHKITVAGRTSEMIDKFGEAVFGDEARAAIQHASDATGAHVTHYHVAPRALATDTVLDVDAEALADGSTGAAVAEAAPSGDGARTELPGHEWLVEFETPPSDVDAFADAIDAHLQKVNRHYQIRREARAFDPPRVTVLPKDAFYDWLKATKDNISGQTKVPRMSESRDVANGILQTLRKAR